jgi:vesicle transport through interaction with t-SNAREs protein 1
VIRRCEKQLGESVETLDSMEKLARSHSGDQKARTMAKVRSYKEQLGRAKEGLRNAQNTSNRNDLLGGSSGDDLHAQGLDQRSRLLAADKRLEDSNNRLQNSKKTVANVESMGTEVLGTLGQQRKQLEKTKDHLDSTDAAIGRSSKLIKTMARRTITNKLIILLVIFMLLGVIGIIIYFKWLKKPSNQNNKPAASQTPTPTPHKNATLNTW